MKKNPDDLSSKVLEVEAIFLAFQIRASKWQRQQIKVYTDNINSFLGLCEFTLKSLTNTFIREIWLLVAK